MASFEPASTEAIRYQGMTDKVYEGVLNVPYKGNLLIKRLS